MFDVYDELPEWFKSDEMTRCSENLEINMQTALGWRDRNIKCNGVVSAITTASDMAWV